MSSSSSSSPAHIKRYHVFPSFHGPDVRRGFLSHLHFLFASKGITTFKDQEIERGHTIGPELVQAIRESRVSIVLLSKNYASSSWCLDELVEILKCKEDHGQMVMTIFHDVDPSDVRKQRGEFGSAFEKTCEGKTEEEKQRWSKALAYVATIAGEHSLNWTDEARMVEKFATDVSNKLNVTLSRDFDSKVGLQNHLRKLNSLLCLECSEVKMIGIWGPAGIGKSTIARALFNHLCSDFGLRCFMGNLNGSYTNIMGVDDYDSKLSLQNNLLSKLLNQRDIRVHHLGSIKEWLHDQRVLIILDDVDDLDQLEVLANEPSWFGPGSRIIVTTEDKQILKAHGVHDIYHVKFPSSQEALEILCLSAFKQSSPRDGFIEVATSVAYLCGNLPLGLCVVGSSLRGESKQEWELQLSRIDSSLDRKIEGILRMGYDRLSKTNQSLFLHIACFFKDSELVYCLTSTLADSNLDVENGLKTLAMKSLVDISKYWVPYMHSLLQKLGRQIVNEQSDEPGKRQFLEDSEEICDVLANETGTGAVIGISFNMYKSKKLSVSDRAFKRMRNLRFLRIYHSEGVSLEVSKDMEYLPRLRLLDWYLYPRKCLPSKFQPACLVELRMRRSNLKKLWGGIQPLPNLKAIDLSKSLKLKEIPNLLEATNLERLRLEDCTSLVELPSSIRNLHKLICLKMRGCVKLRVIPTNINLASLWDIDMSDCSQLRSFPDISTTVRYVSVSNTKIEDIPAFVVGVWLSLSSRSSLKRLTHVPKCIHELDLSNSDIKRIPDCLIDLPHLRILILNNCRKLEALPSLPPSVSRLDASNCGSLKSVCFSFDKPKVYMTSDDCQCVRPNEARRRVSSYFDDVGRGVTFSNCISLDEEARKAIIQRWVYRGALLPGKEIPAEFTHKAKGNSITISEGTFSASSRFKACLLLSSTEQVAFAYGIPTACHLRSKGVLINELNCWGFRTERRQLLMDHLFIFSGGLFKKQRCLENDAAASEIQFEFTGITGKIIECGVQIMAEEDESSSSIGSFGLSL